MNLFYVSSEHKTMMEQLKYEIEKWKCYPILGEIQIPVDGDVTTTDWYRTKKYELFVEQAHVLITDTTHTPPIHQKLKGFLRNHKILLVECRKALNPRSCPELNPAETREYILTLEYKSSIMEVSSYILSKICLHHANLNLIKSTA